MLYNECAKTIITTYLSISISLSKSSIYYVNFILVYSTNLDLDYLTLLSCLFLEGVFIRYGHLLERGQCLSLTGYYVRGEGAFIR